MSTDPNRFQDDLALDTFRMVVTHDEDEGNVPAILHNLHALRPLEYPLIDCHVHAVNFLQETRGFGSLLEAMDRAGITKAVVFGLPVTKMWQEAEREPPEYYLDDDAPCYYYSYTDSIIATEYLRLDEASRARIYPLLCGFNPTDRHAIQHIRRVYEQYPWVFRGIGEVFFRHDTLTLLTGGEIPRINNSTIYPILEFVTDYDLPLLIHNNISSTWTGDHPRYLYELEDTLRKFPKAKIVLCHCGASRNISVPFYRAMLDRLLTEHEALYVDFAWVVFDEIICRWGVIEDEWYTFTEKFSQRILLGSDIIGNFHKIGVINSRYMPFLSHLSETARHNICHENAERLFGMTKNRVENDERRKYPLLPAL